MTPLDSEFESLPLYLEMVELLVNLLEKLLYHGLQLFY
jgi:hypothetical protein